MPKTRGVAGIAVVVVVVMAWATAAWAAWWVVFSAADGAVVDAASGEALLADEGWTPEAWERRRTAIRAGGQPPG